MVLRIYCAKTVLSIFFCIAGVLTIALEHAGANPNYTMDQFTSMPISIQLESATPQVQINTSNDHQLYFKAYNDYGDLDSDGQPETTYKHSIDYYGYFDSKKCYKYNDTNTRFEPDSVTTDKYCTPGNNLWSGNFLNWASMTRIDAIRKILFGGHRRVDTKTTTVLERSFLPPDIHSFAKYYNRTDIGKLTPFKSTVADYSKTSTTTVDIGFGKKEFYVSDVQKWNRIGDWIEAVDNATSTNFIAGTVIKVDHTTNILTVNVTSKGGSGSISNWTVRNKTIDAEQHDSSSSRTFPNSLNVTYTFDTFDPEKWNVIGDYIEIRRKGDYNQYMRGWVTGINASTKTLSVNIKVSQSTDTTTLYTDWEIANLTRTGITLCNVTYAPGDIYSEEVTDSNPPLIRVADGNYQFWSAGEVHQCLWEDEYSASNGDRGKNYNNPEFSGSPAAQDNPYKSVRLPATGTTNKDFVAKVLACVDVNKDGVVDDKDGSEKCKKYPYGNYKPIGLLQEYGDTDSLIFGMIAGTYTKNITGGDMVMPLFHNSGGNNMCREINLGRDCDGDLIIDDYTDTVNGNQVPGDGTFKKVFSFVGGPATFQNAEGLINSWSLYRIKGYRYDSWTYGSTQGDNCSHSVNFFGDISGTKCENWGNPFAEIYLTALRHWAGENSVPTSYQANDKGKGVFEGLNYNNGVWKDPLTLDNYCAPLSIINFNSSVISADTAYPGDKDELDASSQGIVKDLNAPYTATEFTNRLGRGEGIDVAGSKWFIGENNSTNSKTCTAKALPNFGDARGLCSEGPSLGGGYRIAGMAWYSHTTDIRPDNLSGNRGLKGVQTVDNYSVRLASGNPIIEIPVPGTQATTNPQTVTLVPSCINQDKQNYGCTLVDFKIITPHYTETIGGQIYGRGKFLAIWEDSLQGSDYDLDAGGIYEYEIVEKSSTAPAKITVKTAITLQNLGDKIGHGYVISGTSNLDGLHIYSGTNGFTYTDPLNSRTPSPGLADCSGKCYDYGGMRSQTYDIGSSSGKMLEDPLWYAAKWGGFVDKNGNNLPDLVAEWDSKINKTGAVGSDGIPDNYYFASHPQELEDSLRATFDAILERSSSGTAAAVVSSNVRGEGALYQAFYEPLKKEAGKETRWVGTLQSLWLDSYGYTRQDCSSPRGYNTSTGTCVPPTGPCVPDGILDNYCIDQVVETYYDDIYDKTRVKVFNSTEPEKYTAMSLQGVVSSLTAGVLTVEPNALEGNTTYNSTTGVTTFSPYSMVGTVKTYDAATGLLELVVPGTDVHGPLGGSASAWIVYDVTKASAVPPETVSGTYNGSIVFQSYSSGLPLSITISPLALNISTGDVVRVTTKKAVGRLGDSFVNWDISCANGAKGKILGTPTSGEIVLRNEGDDSFVVQSVVGDITTCGTAKITTYNMQGQENASYSQWDVANLDTVFGRGESVSPVSLSNSGLKTLTVTPALSWLQTGDRVSISNYTFTVVELDEVGYLWNAREELYLNDPVVVTDTQLATQRSYSSPSYLGRYINTWVDDDLDGDIDNLELRDFTNGMFTSSLPVKPGYFDVTTIAEGKDVVDFVRGVSVANTRNRSVKYRSTDTKETVQRLGDIIDSTPTVVGSPQEGFNLLYGDKTYAEFRKQYQDRRIVIYSGANDGLLHAFNGGFFETTTVNGKKTIQYSKAGKDPVTGGTATAHPLGGELWAYAPYNLLPHLKWLKDINYGVEDVTNDKSHVYYVNGKPRVFDANIFSPSSKHVNGWGTVMVVGMSHGGGQMEVDTDNNDHSATPSTADNTTLQSAYMVFDITNPEDPPVLLGEITLPDDSYTTVYPAVISFRDAVKDSAGVACGTTGSNCVNKWYLMFGNGPKDIKQFSTNVTAKVYYYDLTQLTPVASVAPTTLPTGCIKQNVTTATHVIACDTGVANRFIGTPVVVDWDLDFYGDTSYFGLVGDATGDKGSIWRMAFNNGTAATKYNNDPKDWYPPLLLYQTNQPIVGQPTPGIDDKNNKWVYWGTGRYFTTADKSSTNQQTLYGVKDSGTTVTAAQLLDVTNTGVNTDRTLVNPPTPVSGGALTTFDDIVKQIDTYAKGWKRTLPPIVGTTADPATRNFTRSALLGGVLFSSVFQPSIDACAGEGESRLYGLFYKTGTAYPGPAILGTTVTTVGQKLVYLSNPYINLGGGVATAPAIHSGSGSGETGVSVFTQLSTGDIVRGTGQTVETIRTGKTSWSDR